MDEFMERIQEELRNTNTRLDKMQVSLDTLQDSIDTVQASQKLIYARLNALGKQFDGGMETLDEQITNSEKRILEKLDSVIEEIKRRLEDTYL